MSLFQLREIDNRDDRREIYRLLDLLTPDQRIQFLRWCLTQVNGNLRHNGSSVQLVATSETGETAETYFDLLNMSTHYGLPWDVVLRELEKRASAVRLWLP